ncbi:small monomeric GTPase [Entamoeba marina]
MTTCKIVMLGRGSVGKTSISTQFVSNVFKSIYEPTIEDSFKTSINVNGTFVIVELLDTAGQEEYNSLRDQYIKTGEGFIIVYSIIDEKSFIDVNNYKDIVRVILGKEEDEHINACLCGNKVDLDEYRIIPTETAATIAEEWKMLFLKLVLKQNTILQKLVESKKQATELEEHNSKKKCILF